MILRGSNPEFQKTKISSIFVDGEMARIKEVLIPQTSGAIGFELELKRKRSVVFFPVVKIP